jgi:hypothetical protein
MAANAATTRQAKLIAELEELKRFAQLQTAVYVSSTEKLYEGLARVYLWWREANKEQGLLDRLYKENGIQYKKVTGQKVNYSPLLRYLWNIESKTKGATLQQWSKALNKLNDAFERGSYFKKEPQLRIVEYIKSKGGLLKLAGYVIKEPSKEKKGGKRSKAKDGEMQSTHLEEGKSYFVNQAPPLTTIKLSEPLPVTDVEEFTLALLRKRNNSYELLSTVEDSKIIEQAVVDTYRRSASHMPNTVRLLTEIIGTQSLPKSIAEQGQKLAEKSKYKAEGTKEVRYQLRRLLYLASSSTFVLSANRSDCSVVTIARPRANIIDSAEDVALAVGDRRFIEDDLIHTGDAAWFAADGKVLVPETEEGPASHKLELINTVTKKKRNVRFYPLPVYDSEASRKQAVLKAGVTAQPKYSATLTHKWLGRMNALFLSKWLTSKSKGTKMTRDEYAVLELAFGKTMVTICHTYESDKFSHGDRIDFDDKVTGKGSVRSLVLSKDIVPVLKALVQMDIVGDVEVQADEKMVGFVFATECADYKIAVPCSTAKRKRIGDYFESYGA